MRNEKTIMFFKIQNETKSLSLNLGFIFRWSYFVGLHLKIEQQTYWNEQ